MSNDKDFILSAYKDELKSLGFHHASKEFKDKVAEKLKEIESGDGVVENPIATTVTLTEQHKEEPKESPVMVETPQKKGQKTQDVKEEFEIDPNGNYVFTLNRKEHLRIIPREALVWDEEEGKTRKIRYVKTESSPYVDEQDELAEVDRSPIMFQDGRKSVSGRDSALVRYLLAYDGNGGKKDILPQNRGIKNLYTLFDPGAKAKNDRKIEELRNKARTIVQESDFERLRAFLRSIYGAVVNSEDEAKTYAYTKINSQYTPGKTHASDIIIEDFTNPKHLLKSKIQDALQKGIIKTTGDRVLVASTGALIVRYDSKDVKNRYDEVLAKHILLGGDDKEALLKLINQ